MANQPLIQKWITEKESKLLDIVRKVLWGSVEVQLRGGDIKTVKKIVETINFDEK